MYQPEKLKARRKELKLTQKDIADQLGISYQAYSAWERGVKEPSKEKVKRLEQILKVSKGYFTEIEIVRLYNTLSNKGKNQVVEYARDLMQKEKTQKVISVSENLYEYHVYEKMSAGIGASVYDDRNYDTVYFDEELAHDFASWVSGDSMEPKYHNKDLIWIEQTACLDDGEIGIFYLDGNAYVKKFQNNRLGTYLISLNKKYAPKVVNENSEFHIFGKVVGKSVASTVFCTD